MCETIGFCNANNIPGCIVAIDQAKAFDTISNRYMLEVYKFFSFQENMINLLMVLGSNRTATISFDDGSFSPEFNLERGRTQGNGPSPCEYNFGQQILLFKIELCPEIASVYNHFQVPRTRLSIPGAVHPAITSAIAEEDNIRFRNESGTETDKAEGFADDTSVATAFEYGSLCSLKEILIDFSVFSGLKCNLEKTAIVQIGNTVPISDEIRDLGFTFSDRIRILGMDLSNDPADWDQNFTAILDTMRKKIEFWKRFNLSLPGRINITKSILMSPITHLGCFLTPSKPTTKALQKCLNDFCKDKLNVAQARLTIPVTSGGMGLLDVEEFLIAQQASWIFRTKKSCRDNWRNDIMVLSHGNPLAFSPQNTDPVRHPILCNLAKSYERVRILFDKKNENYHYAAIFNHPMLFREPRDKETLDPTYLEIDNNPMLIQKFASQELQNFCGPDGVLTRAELWRAGLQLSVTGYVRLSNSLLCFLERIDVDRNTNGESSTIFDTFCTIKKPAKKCRIFLTSSRNQDLEKLTTTGTFFRLVGLEYTGNKNYEINVCWWNFFFLPNRIRTFAFKFYNNILGLNTRTSHFIINPNRNCTFCSLTH